eukprot:1365625-Amorphochlora_amoeboformis.AAC.1
MDRYKPTPTPPNTPNTHIPSPSEHHANPNTRSSEVAPGVGYGDTGTTGTQRGIRLKLWGRGREIRCILLGNLETWIVGLENGEGNRVSVNRVKGNIP